MKKRKLLRRICIVLAVVLVLFFSAGFWVGNFFYDLALNPHVDKSRVVEAEENEVDYDEAALNAYYDARAWFEDTDYTETTLVSFDGLKLNAYLLENRQSEGNNWVLIAHGYNSAARVMSEWAREFYQRGYSLLMPDARGCGRSEGDYIGMGWHDRLDVLGWLEQLNETFAPDNIVLFGASMGATTVMMASGEQALPANVRAVVEDCGYSSAWGVFAHQAGQLFGIPAFPVLNFCSAVTRIRAGFWLGEADAVAQVARSTTPTLFIHGSDDQFVPAAMQDELYEAAVCEKERLLVEGAGHAGSANKAPELYWDTIDRFLKKYMV